MANIGFDPTIGPASSTGTAAEEWNAGTVNALGTGLALTGGTLVAAPIWNAGNVGTVAGPGIVVASDIITVEWNAGTVTSLGSGVTLTAGVLTAGGGGGGSAAQVVTLAPFTRPALSSFTWNNQQSATATDHANGPLSLSNAAGTDNNIHGLQQSVPGSTPWTVTAQLSNATIGGTSGSAFTSSGIYLTDGTGFDILHIGMSSSYNTPGPVLEWEHWTNATTFSSVVFSLYYDASNPWLRISWSGTTATFSVSPNGADWQVVHASSLEIGTPTAAGFCVLNTESYPQLAVLNLWELTTGAGSTATFQATY